MSGLRALELKSGDVATGRVRGMRKAVKTTDQIATTMIELARCGHLHQIIVAGAAVPQHVSELVIWIDAAERSGQRKLRSILGRLRFRVEAGTRCEDGFAVSARRLDSAPIAIAA